MLSRQLRPRNKPNLPPMPAVPDTPAPQLAQRKGRRFLALGAVGCSARLRSRYLVLYESAGLHSLGQELIYLPPCRLEFGFKGDA